MPEPTSLPLPFRAVLLRPRSAENLGAAARALKNCGLSDWAWVAPEAEELAPAHRMAVHATELLETVRRPATLDEAVSDCVWVVGTSSRQLSGKRRLSAREFAEEAVRRAPEGPIAIVFGDERSGLRNEELLRCHDLSTVPTDPSQPSVNLAQAVLLYAYELRMAYLASLARPPPQAKIAATDRELAQLEQVLGGVLVASGFQIHPERHALKDLIAPLRRSRLTRAESKLWSALLHTVRKRLPRGSGES